MTQKEWAEAAKKILGSFIAEITGMETGQTIQIGDEDDEPREEEMLIGTFGTGEVDVGGSIDDGYRISWPCILILRDQARDHLKLEVSHD